MPTSDQYRTPPRFAWLSAGVRFLVRAAVLLAPAGIIALGGVVVGGENPGMYWVGAAVVGFMALVLLPQARLRQPSTALAVVALYVLGQVWLWFCGGEFQRHWFPHLAQGLMLVIPTLLFADVTLARSGAGDLRRARVIIRRLLSRRDWPADRGLIQALPDVLALRESVTHEAAPALALLHHPRPEIQVAMLASLAYRRFWGLGQAEAVLEAAQHSSAPAVRVAALTALVHSDDRFLLEALAEFLRDPAPEVRRAAAEVIFANAAGHWTSLRYHVHDALADPQLVSDRALPLPGGELPPAVVADLFEWAAEGGDLARRATFTLVAYYGQLLNSHANPDQLAADLRAVLLDRAMPAVLRVELGQLLHDQHRLDGATLEPLLGAEHPVALRLLSADTLLAAGVHSQAEQAVREIARLPNREITLGVAQIVQRRLGVDLGLNLQKPPAPNSRQAAEVTRRVMQWSVERATEAAGHAPDEGSEGTTRQRSTATSSDWDLGPFPDQPEPPRGNSGLTRW